MNRTCLPDPELGTLAVTFELTKNSTFGDGDSGFNSRNDSRFDSDVRPNDTRLSNLSTIGDSASLRMGMFFNEL